ncbi:uncharacterized protein LOC132205570 [Neocloeon triangulifer]|uniref:uncharacterized protein LOC132205570 n=1 Tax=Neocloeon triangulifer TaxID=2078957 RepID=UPI00286F5705|nr:uncharacterized protein LOC132205570 [Neocloeon triangulifer]
MKETAQMTTKIDSLKVDDKIKYLFDYVNDEQVLEIVKEAQNAITSNIYRPDEEFPSPDFFQEFAGIVYKKKEQNEKDWLLLLSAEGKVVFKLLEGFYAQLYFNKEKRQLLLAIRGSKTVGNWFRTDIGNVLLKYDGGEINSAFTFSERVRKLVAEFKSPVQLFITGHSLGGYLAQMTTYTIRHLRINNNIVCKNSESENLIYPHTVVFDSPPCFDRIKKIAQENPVTIKSLWLDITNFVVDGNLINSFSKLGPHLGMVISLKDSNQLASPSLWSLIKNVGLHGIANFNDIKGKEMSQLIDISRAKAVNFDSKLLPWFAFDEREIESIKTVPFLTLTDRKSFDELPKFNFENGNIRMESSNACEFIPRLRSFLLRHREKFQTAVAEVQNHFDSLMKEAWKLLYEEVENIDFKLNSDFVTQIGGRHILGLKRMEEKMILAKLMHNSIEKLYFINQDKFLKIEHHQRDNWLRSFNGILVIILEEKEEIVPFESYNAKVVLIGGTAGEAEDAISIKKITCENLDERSQHSLLTRKIDFFGNQIEISKVYDYLINDLSLADALKFPHGGNTNSNWETEFYIEQDISNILETYPKIDQFAKNCILECEKGAFLVSSNAGMGKSTYLRMLRKCLQKTLPDHWIVRLELNTCHNEFYEIKKGKSKLETAREALEILAKKIEPTDLIRHEVLQVKLASKRAFILLDAFDEVCPYYREEAKKFLNMIHSAGMIMIVTTRPQEEQEILDCLLNKNDWSVFKLEFLSEEKQVEYLVEYWSHIYERNLNKDDLNGTNFIVPRQNRNFKTEAESILEKLRRKFTSKEDLWGIPLQLRMVAEAFPDGKLTEAFERHSDLFSIFIEQRIALALREKFKYDLTQAKQRGDLDEKERKIRLILYKLAIASIFEEGRCSKVDESEASEMNTLGLATVTQSLSGYEVAFLHRTFAEYLCAESFVFKIYDVPGAERLTVSNKNWEEVMLGGNFLAIRRFMNTIIAHSSLTSSKKPKLLLSGQKLMANCQFLLSDLVEADQLHLLTMLFELKMPFDLNNSHRYNPLLNLLNVHKLFGKVNNSQYDDFPLYWAIRLASAELINYLVNKGAEIKNVDCTSKQHPVLHWAAKKGVNKLIIDNFDHMGKMINTPDFNRRLPIHYAVMEENLELIRFLIYKGSDCNIVGFDRKSPLVLAIETGNLESVKLICETSGIQLNVKGHRTFTPVQTAIYSSNMEIFSYLLTLVPKLNLEVKSNHGTALDFAVERGEEEMVHILHEKGADPKSCLHAAAKMGRDKLINYFLQEIQLPVDGVDELGRTPLYLAVENGNIDVVRILMENNANPNAELSYYMTPLQLAVSCAAPKFEIVRLLVSSDRRDFDIQDEQGMTALHLACMGGHADIMGLLISQGADPDARDKLGNSALQLAESCGHHDAIKMIQGVLNVHRNRLF